MTTEPKRRTASDDAAVPPGGTALVIVESPAKARTIARFLGDGFIVESSIGHIRDLPSSAAEIPAAKKKESWARLGVDVDHDFQPLYVIPASKKPQVAKLRKLMKQADALYLATDEDREGEAIAWHLREVLKPKVPVQRMVFHEITQEAIQDALDHPRELDDNLIAAQEARRILDRIFGYEVSPVLWKKVKPRLSAGRVQSAAIRLLVQRERLRMAFNQGEYWDLAATLNTLQGAPTADDGSRTVRARLVELDGKRIANGKDFDDATGQLTDASAVVLLDTARATALGERLSGADFAVSSVTERPFTQRPPAPFVTSSLQQEAARKLRYTAQRTMQVAQALYENGYITYMRTDSTTLSQQALSAARGQVVDLYGAAYIPDSPRFYATRSKGAQEAHEAIRPAGEVFRTPDSLQRELEGDQFRLYDLIWKRTLASQMRDANGNRTQVRIRATDAAEGVAEFAASGKVITFPGFLRAYVEGSDDPDAELGDQERVLPPLDEGQALAAAAVEPRGHETQPPARFTEASLIRELEERGIGRPSTYASIIQTVQARGYAWKKGTALVPTLIAFAVVNLLEQHFPGLVNFDFTARMEEDLDSVAAGSVQSGPWLHDFYFGNPHAPDSADALTRTGLKERIGSGWEEIDARAVSSIHLGETAEGKRIYARVGRYGPYLQVEDEDLRANLPDDLPPDELTLSRAIELLDQAAKGDQSLGDDPETGLPIYLKTGRFGPYVQLGEDDEDTSGEGKPKRGSLWPTMSMDTITLEQAIDLLSYPRTLGIHPETQTAITAQNGPRGPYMRMGDDSRSLDGFEQLASIDLAGAIEIFKQPKRGRGARASVLRVIGEHPDSGDSLELRSGRFGPYVTDGVVNASIPKGSDPGAVTLEQAVDLIAAREQKMRDQGKDPRAKAKPKPRAKAKAKPKAKAKGGKGKATKSRTRPST